MKLPWRKKPPIEAPDEPSIPWQVSILDEAAKSSHRWRTGFWMASTALFASVIGLVVLATNQNAFGYLIVLDKRTGAIDVQPAFPAVAPGIQEAMDRYWLGQYVLARESYNPATWRATYKASASFESSAMQVEHEEQWHRSNPNSPVILYKEEGEIQVDIMSVRFNDDAPGTAVVEFNRTERRRGIITNVARQIATVNYHYAGSPPQTELWFINPQGMIVTGYRVTTVAQHGRSS